MRKLSCLLLAACVARSLMAQQPTDLKDVIDRLDRLEAQNRDLMAEIRALRLQLAASQPTPSSESSSQTAGAETPPQPLAERVEVTERRIADLDQSKVSSEHRLPVSLTGMLLFNAFLNGKGAGGADNPTVLPPNGGQGQASGGATFRQSVIGLKVDGPGLIGGGKVTGAIYMDFFGGGTGLNQTVRLRVATLDATWKNTTLGLAFDKPIIAPREPDSLAQVGVSPLTSAGNLWLWQPQVRVEQRISLTEQAGLRAQFGVYQTAESGTGLTSPDLARARPGYQGRFEFWAKSGSRRIEIAPGFHVSSTRVLGQSVPSRIASIDWLIRPAARVDFTGTFFHGENTGVLGGLRQGVNVINGQAHAVRATGGWAQFTFRATRRASFNIYGGQEDDRNRDLSLGAVGKNQGYGANIIYRLGSNILTSFESSQMRTTYLGSHTVINPHYDLAFAYLF